MHIAETHIKGEVNTYVYDRNSASNAEVKIWFNRLLDDPTKPLWRIQEMYDGINKDKNTMSTEELAVKYGMTDARIIGIMNMPRK